MANRGTYWVDDVYGWSILTAPSSIYPAGQATTPVAPSTSRTEELDTLLPWGCDQADQAPQDQA
jgi:hypothetical protein